MRIHTIICIVYIFIAQLHIHLHVHPIELLYTVEPLIKDTIQETSD